jgi:hypothetical protein
MGKNMQGNRITNATELFFVRSPLRFSPSAPPNFAGIADAERVTQRQLQQGGRGR